MIMGVNATPKEDQVSLRVLSWNIDGLQTDSGDLPRIQQILHEIRKCNADIVCLQEVTDPIRDMMTGDLRHK